MTEYAFFEDFFLDHTAYMQANETLMKQLPEIPPEKRLEYFNDYNRTKLLPSFTACINSLDTFNTYLIDISAKRNAEGVAEANKVLNFYSHAKTNSVI